MSTRKQKGAESEQIALTYLESIGLHIETKNYTIPGGEIDIVASSPEVRVFVEVKSVEPDADIAGYITRPKLRALYRAVTTYQVTYPSKQDYRIDVIFVSEGKVIEHYENITLYE